MLESMITNPRPTRAECADVANAVLDGTDCVMLSGETANGEYPGNAVRMMASTCVEAESIISYDNTDALIREKVLAAYGHMSAAESIASSAAKTAWDVKAKLIIVLTETGNTARLISKYRPNVPVFVVTTAPFAARQSNGYLKNCTSKVVPAGNGVETNIAEAIIDAKNKALVVPGDLIVVIFGSKEQPGATNMVRVMTV